MGLDGISASFYQFFTENLSEVDILDASDLVDEIKAVKSADEIALIRKTAALHDQIASAVPDILRPGRYEYEIRNEIKKSAGIIVDGDEVTTVRELCRICNLVKDTEIMSELYEKHTGMPL